MDSQIQFGILCDKEITGYAEIFIQRKSSSPVILQNIQIKFINKNFRVRFASYYRTNLIIPYKDQRVMIGHLLINYIGSELRDELEG